MDHQEARRFVDQWVEDWNKHDVEAVLSHFADEGVFTSPGAQRVVPDSGGVVRGKAALREYWNAALPHVPDLHFELVGAYFGVSTIVINYRNQRGDLINEVLVFDGDFVVEGHATQLDR